MVSLYKVFNASEEIVASSNYTEIRVFTASKKQSVKPEIDLLGVDEKWSVPAAESGECIAKCIVANA